MILHYKRPRPHAPRGPRRARSVELIGPSITPSLQDAIAREFEYVEKVVWSAMPKRRYFVEPAPRAFRSGIGLTASSIFMVVPIGIFPGFTSLRLFFLVGGKSG